MMSTEVQTLLDELRSRFGVDPTDGLQLLTPAGVLRRPFDPGMAVLLLPDADSADGSVLPGRGAHGDSATQMLRDLYPADHPAYGLSGTQDTTVGQLADASIDRHTYFLPAVEPLANLASPHALPWLVARLRAPDGCPWDREQDHLTLRKFLHEETYEVYDALEK